MKLHILSFQSPSEFDTLNVLGLKWHWAAVISLQTCCECSADKCATCFITCREAQWSANWLHISVYAKTSACVHWGRWRDNGSLYNVQLCHSSSTILSRSVARPHSLLKQTSAQARLCVWAHSAILVENCVCESWILKRHFGCDDGWTAWRWTGPRVCFQAQ